MQLFFRCKTRSDQLNWIDKGIVEYEYQSLLSFSDMEYNVKIVINIESLEEDKIDYIRKWAHESFENEHFYREISFGIISDSKIIKEIIFPYSYIGAFDETFDYTLNFTSINLHIKERKDKFKGIKISPKILIKKTLPSPMSNFNQKQTTRAAAKPILDLETKNVKLFEIKLSKQEGITPGHAEILIKRFACGSKTAQNVFLKYVPDNSLKFVNFDETTKYNYITYEKRIEADIIQDMSNKHARECDYFHEHGHLIDLRKTRADLGYPDIGTFSEDEEFYRLLKQDFENYIAKHMRENNVTRDIACKQIFKTINCFKYYIICDLFGGLSENAFDVEYTHPMEYWNRDPMLVRREAVAHFFEVQFNPKRLKVVKKFFPESMIRFEKLLKMQDKSSCVIS